MEDETETLIPGERAEMGTGGHGVRKPLARRGVAVLAVICFIGFAMWSMRDPPPRTDDAGSGDVVIRQMADFEPAPKKEKMRMPASVPLVELPVPAPKAESKSEETELLDAARRAPVMAFDGEEAGSPEERAGSHAGTGSPYLPVDGQWPFGESDGSESKSFEHRLRATRLKGSRAGRLGNRDLIIAMGTTLPCILETAMSSDQPGFVKCVVGRDILSDNGRVVLMEKGTEIVGEYRGATRPGQRRLFVLWKRAKTPTGVIITLASPATDALGRAGVGGYVDSHWWERFGSSLLLSIVGDTSSYASAILNDQAVPARNTVEAGKGAAAIAVENSIKIGPTIEKHQGELVTVFVARDLDFSEVYSLRVVEPMTRIYDRAALGDFVKGPRLITK